MNLVRPSSSRSALSLLLALCAGLALFALACDSGTQEPDAPAPEAAAEAPAADAADSAATPPAATKREGEIDPSRFPSELAEGASASVPAAFPSDLPVYPGAQPAQGKGAEIEGSPQSLTHFLTNDAYPEVHRNYAGELTAKGWTIDSENENEMAATIEASKDKCKAQILITPVEGGGSDIFIATEC
jgi:hypothetical protein